MANLQIKGMDDRLYEEVKALAASANRSVSQQVIFLLKAFLSRRTSFEKAKSSAQVLLDLSGSWEDDRTASEIAHDLRSARKSSKRFKEGL